MSDGISAWFDRLEENNKMLSNAVKSNDNWVELSSTDIIRLRAESQNELDFAHLISEALKGKNK